MIKIGSIYQTNSYGPIKVVAKTDRSDFYVIRFLRTGTEKAVRGYQISNGCVRDPYAKTLCGVAAIGDIKTKGKYRPYYNVWHDMINRCYNPSNKRASAYATVLVDDRWLVFQNFYEDASHIEGFDEHKFMLGELVLDKDTKQRRNKQKIYARDTCAWVSKHENNQIQDAQQRPFVAIAPDGRIYHEYNITDFARRMGLSRKNISAVLHGRGQTVKQWKFTYEEIV